MCMPPGISAFTSPTARPSLRSWLPCPLPIPPWDEELFTIGLIIDMMIEKGNDGKDYPVLARQDQFDAF